ncbi:MAG: dTDP-4-dehydrorhamnose 3,5-epimerase [Gammaproteobacteria bacterium]|nr:dTDP-4-dehydrorhamnose 3,5-epimerase [Gammaproteobacteria bacterium]
MEIINTAIEAVKVLKPRVFSDDRGFFMESYRASWLEDLGVSEHFVQDNHSKSVKGTLRGLHYQIKNPQGKLVRVTRGEVFDVAVDLRAASPTFGHWVGQILSEENQLQMWVPEGFAHGFVVLSETAEFLYKCTAYYSPQDERAVRWDDPDLAIEWPDVSKAYTLSEKDQSAPLFKDAEYFS